MILNINSLDTSQKNTWSALAKELDRLGYNISVAGSRKGATVFKKESGDNIGEVTCEMVEDEELNYILYSRLDLKKIPE